MQSVKEEMFAHGLPSALDDLARGDRRRSMMGSVRSDGCDLYYEEMGEGVPILLIHPAGSTASTWGAAVDALARIGRVITSDRRGYARSGGEPARSMSTIRPTPQRFLSIRGSRRPSWSVRAPEPRWPQT
jgi:pimeloyl-ACP methyl ester carboxylesterase